jgi:hypothetical protein
MILLALTAACWLAAFGCSVIVLGPTLLISRLAPLALSQ